MRKAKSWEKRKADLKAPERSHLKFEVTQSSHPRKATRWLGRGGRKPANLFARSPEQIRRAHIHPRFLRDRA